jgi:hypothetical protein
VCPLRGSGEHQCLVVPHIPLTCMDQHASPGIHCKNQHRQYASHVNVTARTPHPCLQCCLSSMGSAHCAEEAATLSTLPDDTAHGRLPTATGAQRLEVTLVVPQSIAGWCQHAQVAHRSCYAEYVPLCVGRGGLVAASSSYRNCCSPRSPSAPHPVVCSSEMEEQLCAHDTIHDCS